MPSFTSSARRLCRKEEAFLSQVLTQQEAAYVNTAPAVGGIELYARSHQELALKGCRTALSARGQSDGPGRAGGSRRPSGMKRCAKGFRSMPVSGCWTTA